MFLEMFQFTCIYFKKRDRDRRSEKGLIIPSVTSGVNVLRSWSDE